MQIFIKLFSGTTYTINANINDTIFEVKQELSKKFDYPSKAVHLIFAGKGLEDHRTLMDYNV